MVRPFVEGKRIYLRKLVESDADGPYPDWFNDPVVTENNGHHGLPFSRQDALDYIRRMNTPSDEIAFAIVARDGDSHVGNVAFKKIDRVAQTAELALVIGERSIWGQGIGSEVCRLMCDYGFGTLNLQRIHCATFETNDAMQRLALSLGMREEGRRRRAAYKNGRFVDTVEFGLLREEYVAASK